MSILPDYRDPAWTALLPRHGIHLFAPGADPATASKFAEVWRSTWPQVSLRARRRLLAYWRAQARGAGVVLRVSLGGWKQRDPGDLGFASELGCRLDFWPPVVVEMPPAALAGLIAHELAHCVQWAIGILEELGDEAEEDADGRVRYWGIDLEPLEQWEAENRAAILARDRQDFADSAK